MGVDHRRFQVRVPEQFLDGPDIVTSLYQMGGETVSQRMDRCRLGHSEARHRLMYMFLQGSGVQVIPIDLVGPWVYRKTARRKNPIPTPFKYGFRVFPLQSEGKGDARSIFPAIRRIKAPDIMKVSVHFRVKTRGEQRNPVTVDSIVSSP